MRTILNRDNAVKAYLWVEMLALSFLVVFVSMQLHFMLIPLIGILIMFRLKDSIDQYYRFVYSFLLWLYILQIYIYIRDQAYFIGIIGLTGTLIIFMLLLKEEQKGKTL